MSDYLHAKSQISSIGIDIYWFIYIIYTIVKPVRHCQEQKQIKEREVTPLEERVKTEDCRCFTLLMRRMVML